jgi:hypothetical protein
VSRDISRSHLASEAGKSRYDVGSVRRETIPAHKKLRGAAARGPYDRLARVGNWMPKNLMTIGSDLIISAHVENLHWPGAHELILQRWIVPPGSFLIGLARVEPFDGASEI